MEVHEEDDGRVRKIMSEIYQDGFIKLISKRTPGLIGQMEALLTYLGANDHRGPLSETYFGFVVHFSDIQRMYMRSLHAKLINIAVSIQRISSSDKPEESFAKLDEFGAVMKKYVRAVQDHEYMAKFALKSNDPFVATSKRHNDRIFFETALFKEGLDLDDFLTPGVSTTSETENGESEGERRQREWIDRLLKASIPAGPWETFDHKTSHKSASGLINTRTTSAKVAFWERVGAAAIGGAFLIAPMWILALRRELFVHLGVATGCVTAFGVSVSYYLETVDGVFAATLAYAAVIMVFVGVVLETGGQGA